MSTQVLRPARRWGRRVAGAALAGLLSVGALGACTAGGGGGDASTMSGDSGGMAQQDTAAKPAGPGRAEGAIGAVSPESVRTSVGQKLVRQAHLQLKVESLRESAARIRSIAAQQSGVVMTEELHSGGEGNDTSGSITISVPAASLDATIALVEKVGDVQFRNTSSEDVTGTYVDTEARVKSMTASVARIRDLLAKASTVNDLVALENELSQRQAELDALTAQLAHLKDSVSMSPISVSLSTDDFAPATTSGFLSGLKAGWQAFVTSLAVLATTVGAVLPFAVAIALVVAPLVWWLRHRRVGPVATHPAGPPPSAG